MRRIIERTLKSLGVPDDNVVCVPYDKCLHAIIKLDLSANFFKALSKACDTARITFVVNGHARNTLLINFFRR